MARRRPAMHAAARVARRRRAVRRKPKYARGKFKIPSRTGSGRRITRVRSGKRGNQRLSLNSFLNWRKSLVNFTTTHTDVLPNKVRICLNNPIIDDSSFTKSGTLTNVTTSGDPYTGTELTGVNKFLLKSVYIKGVLLVNAIAQPDFWFTMTVFRRKIGTEDTGIIENDPTVPKAGVRDFQVLKRLVFRPGQLLQSDPTISGYVKTIPYQFIIPFNKWIMTGDKDNATAALGADWIDEDPMRTVYLEIETFEQGATSTGAKWRNEMHIKKVYAYLPFTTAVV